jgi:DNA invertase Pin-like site-specific DNA recombinase
MKQAIAYIRTSSATNVGPDKDSDKRQRRAINAFAKANGYQIVDEYYDAGVSGDDHIEDRPGFSAMLDRIESNGVRLVIVEDIQRFARDTLGGLLGLLALKSRDVTAMDVSGLNLTEPEDDMQRVMMEIGLVFGGWEKRRLVRKLKVARDRKSKEAGKRIEGRIGLKGTPEGRAMIKEAKNLRRKPRNGKRKSLRKVSAELAEMGFTQEDGKPYSAMTIKRVTA